ncbi:MAG TPA: hypothetical protein VGV85_06995 [Longimicrobiaceae bacterium]|nr:hypothetical protein [Longimicrobiaceae bacterium]
MKRVALLACALSALLAAHAGAQQAEPAPGYSAEGVRSVFAARAAVPLAAAQTPLLATVPAVALQEPAAAPAPAARAARAGVHDAARSFLHTVGGAVVGGWLGLVTSQVVRSDWEKKSNDEVAGHRVGFALGGALFGGAGGLFIGSRSSSDLRASLRQARRGEQEIISQEEIEAASASDLYELVQRLHPEWLRERGVQSHSQTGKVSGGGAAPTVVTPGLPTILVYQDNARLGGVEALRVIPVADAGTVQFLNAAQATYRFGIGHSNGVILVTTRK